MYIRSSGPVCDCKCGDGEHREQTITTKSTIIHDVEDNTLN